MTSPGDEDGLAEIHFHASSVDPLVIFAQRLELRAALHAPVVRKTVGNLSAHVAAPEHTQIITITTAARDELVVDVNALVPLRARVHEADGEAGAQREIPVRPHRKIRVRPETKTPHVRVELAFPRDRRAAGHAPRYMAQSQGGSPKAC